MKSLPDFGNTDPEYEEARLLDRSGQECYRATSANFSVLRGKRPLYRPYLDEERLRAGGRKPRWPNGAGFAACLTHDVDAVASLNARMHWRRMVGQSRHLLGRRGARAVRALRASAYFFARALPSIRLPDPLHAYQRWLAMEAEVGAKSTFLFLPNHYARPHYSDAGYRYSDQVRFDGRKCSVAEMMREIHRRGWEVGLHASWRSHDCADEMKRQKEQVESAIDASVESVRHHQLHFDIRRTPRVHHEAGLLVDSSLGFNDNIGFRCGTSYPWLLRDFESDRELDVLELPLVVQDKCLVRTLGCDREELALDWVGRIIRRVKAVGGVFTLLWHAGSLGSLLYENVYRQILGMLFAEGACFATMRGIAEIWRAQNRESARSIRP